MCRSSFRLTFSVAMFMRSISRKSPTAARGYRKHMAEAHTKYQELAASPGMARTCWKRPKVPKVWFFEASRQQFPITSDTSATFRNYVESTMPALSHKTADMPTTANRFLASCSQRFPAEQLREAANSQLKGAPGALTWKRLGNRHAAWIADCSPRNLDRSWHILTDYVSHFSSPNFQLVSPSSQRSSNVAGIPQESPRSVLSCREVHHPALPVRWEVWGSAYPISEDLSGNSCSVYLLVGGLEHFLFSHILGIIIPID